MASCQQISEMPKVSADAPLLGKVVAALGDPTALASLKVFHYTAEISTGTGKDATEFSIIETLTYPDGYQLLTHPAKGPGMRMEASPDQAFVQVGDGPKTDIPPVGREMFLKPVRLDRFNVGQHLASGKAVLTEAGHEKIGDIEATVLNLSVDGSTATWYVNPADGRLLRMVTQVPSGFGPVINSTSNYSDWRVCDGLTIPFERIVAQGQKSDSHEKLLTVAFNTAVQNAETSIEKAEQKEQPASHFQNAGGKWMLGKDHDRMTDAEYSTLILRADNPVDGPLSKEHPAIIVKCAQGKMTNALFDSEVVLNNAGSKPTLLGDVPAQDVTLRIGQKVEPLHTWALTNDLQSLWMSRRDIEQLTAATDYRIQFVDAYSHAQVARFSPQGLDPVMLWDTCHIKSK